jgi:hypothetical protein
VLRRLPALLVAGAVSLILVGSAQATSTVCNVNASSGYANCLAFSNPVAEQVKAYHASGLPYRFQLSRLSDGAKWGYWQFSNFDYHVFTLSLSGTITAQVDNLGTGNPSAYYVEQI